MTFVDMAATREQIRVRGKIVEVPSAIVESRTVVVMGGGVKIAAVKDEQWLDSKIQDAATFISLVQQSGLDADIFTFSEQLVGMPAPLPYSFEWDNAAVIQTDDFERWWEALPQETRKNVRRASKRGVTVARASLDDAFVRGIKRIYDESPIRQGRRFWHYGKGVATIRLENESYPDRSELIGAYFGDELIGFMKWVYVGDLARIMQVLTLATHSDKRPMNALFAKAVEICNAKGVKYLVYGKFTYGNKSYDSMVQFKRRLGFEQVQVRKYYVPLTLKGRIAMKLKLHRRLNEILPSWVIGPLMIMRSNWITRRHCAASAPLVD